MLSALLPVCLEYKTAIWSWSPYGIPPNIVAHTKQQRSPHNSQTTHAPPVRLPPNYSHYIAQIKWSVSTALFSRPGVVAHPCNSAAWRPGLWDCLRAGALSVVVLCRLGVRTKPGINMGPLSEGGVSRLSKEGRIGPGQWCSRQKSPCRAVVGSRPWIDHRDWYPGQYSGTQIFWHSLILQELF